MSWLGLCSLLLAFPACTGASPRIGHGLASSVQKARPQRTVQTHGPTPRAVTPVAAVTDADEKERLFRAFVEWQGTQDSNR